MSSLFDSLSEELFQILKGSGKTLTLYGSDGNKTYEPKDARRVFATPDNIMVSVVEAGSDSEVKLYLSQSTDVQAISKLINTLRQITTRYNVLFNVRKYGRELEPKDFAYQASVNEAAMWGTNKTSYQKFGPTKLIIRHTAPVREGVIGSRGRNILSMFVETSEGERFKFPENHLSAGRAFAQHIAQGGVPHDELGLQMVQLATESLNLARVNRYIHLSRNILGEDAVALRPTIRTRIVEIRKAFTALARPRGYHKVKEAGLPLASTNLSESDDFGTKLQGLQTLLQIDSNHALAESLMPVALLQMGENMTDINEMFQGVITLEDAAADALVEALLDEYGYTDESWARFGNNIAFAEGAVFESAQEALDLLEAAYQINEGDAILDYATQWTNHRFGRSEAGGFDSPKDRTKHEAGVSALADGLRAILAGQIDMPDLPETGMPQFRDENAKIRFFLDMFISQNKLGNDSTANYVSTIVDKMADGQKLDGAEKTVASKLYNALKADVEMGESIVDEGTYMEDPYSDSGDRAVDAVLTHFEEDFDGEQFLQTQGYEEFLDHTISPEEKSDPMDASYFIKGIAHQIVVAYENADMVGYNGNEEFILRAATDLFNKYVKPVLAQNGWTINEAVVEFAVEDDRPGHHGIGAGDHVATDYGPGIVDSVEGDLAVVEFLHGGMKTLHVDAMDKLDKLGGVAEEAELAQWFEGFSPEAVLEVNWEHGMPKQAKAKPTNPNFDANLSVGDRVTHKVYGAGEVVALDEKNAKVRFDSEHMRLPEHKTVTMHKGVLSKAGAFRKAADENVQIPEAAKSGPKATAYIHYNGEDDVEVQVEYQIDDGTFHTGLDYPTHHSYGAQVDIDDVRVVATGEDITLQVQQDKSLMDSLTQACIDDAAEAAEYERGQAADYARDDRDFDESMELDELSPAKAGDYFMKASSDRARQERKAAKGDEKAALRLKNRDAALSKSFTRMREDEEVIGGDKGEDLINDVKAEEQVDEAFRAELANLLKNAMFRK